MRLRHYALQTGQPPIILDAIAIWEYVAGRMLYLDHLRPCQFNEFAECVLANQTPTDARIMVDGVKSLWRDAYEAGVTRNNPARIRSRKRRSTWAPNVDWSPVVRKASLTVA